MRRSIIDAFRGPDTADARPGQSLAHPWPRICRSRAAPRLGGITDGFSRSLGGLRRDPAEAGDRSECARAANCDKIMGARRGDANSRREGDARRVFGPVGCVSWRNSARTRLRPAESDRSCAADQPRDACCVASNARRRRPAWHRRRCLFTDARRHRPGELCSPPGLRQDGAVFGPDRCARAVAAAGLAVAGLRRTADLDNAAQTLLAAIFSSIVSSKA
jgi:hypothetical protein